MINRFLSKKLSSFQIICMGFVGMILMGTLLLRLPLATHSGDPSSWEDALFTATSAVCVTGLVVRDTALYWAPFGQAVILILIQVGGLGVVSVAAFIALISGKRIGLLQRSLLQDTISAHQIGGIVKLTGFLFRIAFLTELLGALLLLPWFCGRYGAAGIWMAVFHSVSAFCNAGFDIMGARTGAFSSLTSFSGSLGVTLTVCALIVVGGIGFLTWDDVSTHGFRFRRYRMQSKVILAMTGVLILIPAAVLFFSDFADYPLKERLCLSLFQAVTPRTAGFNTGDLSAMSDSGRSVLLGLMLVGGAPGSTAGGMKITTVAVLAANAVAVFRKRKSVRLFGRRVEDEVVKSAATLMGMYILLAAAGGLILSAAEKLPLGACLFESASALGTVGLSTGITPQLGMLSRGVLVLLMLWGRVGGLTLMFAALSRRGCEVSQCPLEKIAVG